MRFNAIVDEALEHWGLELLGHLNRATNAVVPTTRGDVPWLSPLAALDSLGDCKQLRSNEVHRLGDAGVPATDAS
jgi:hypothetical protein